MSINTQTKRCAGAPPFAQFNSPMVKCVFHLRLFVYSSDEGTTPVDHLSSLQPKILGAPRRAHTTKRVGGSLETGFSVTQTSRGLR